jgi:hypothetical protein
LQRIVGHAVRKEKETECQSGMGVKEEKRGRKRKVVLQKWYLIAHGLLPILSGSLRKKERKKRKEKEKERKKNVEAIYLAIFIFGSEF